MNVRQATVLDGGELQQIMEGTPQRVTDFAFTVVNAPDFFGRTRAYERATIFIAEEHGRLAGSAACAIRDVLIGGRPHRVAYEFQYFTAGDFQRRGVARRLRAQIEDHLIRHGVELATAITSDTNLASIHLFEGHGFRQHRNLDLHLLTVLPHVDMRVDLPIRRAAAADLPAVARLLNETWGRHDLFAPTSADALAAQIDRTTGLARDSILVLEEHEEIVACAGVWDWGQVQRIRIESVEASAHATPLPLVPGQILRQWGLTAVGFRRPDRLATLLRHITNRALDQGIAHVGLVSEPGHALAEALAGFAGVINPVRLYVKPLHSDVALGEHPLFVDMIDF